MKGAADRAREFVSLAAQLDELSATLRTRTHGSAVDHDAAEALNDAMLRLSRILVPVASTVVGPYG
jgi:hypothetical protein